MRAHPVLRPVARSVGPGGRGDLCGELRMLWFHGRRLHGFRQGRPGRGPGDVLFPLLEDSALGTDRKMVAHVLDARRRRGGLTPVAPLQ